MTQNEINHLIITQLKKNYYAETKENCCIIYIKEN